MKPSIAYLHSISHRNWTYDRTQKVADLQHWYSLLVARAAPGAYIPVAEVGTQASREKRMALSVVSRCCLQLFRIGLLIHLADCC